MKWLAKVGSDDAVKENEKPPTIFQQGKVLRVRDSGRWLFLQAFNFLAYCLYVVHTVKK